MQRTYELGRHNMDELEQALAVFFQQKKMVCKRFTCEDGWIILNAQNVVSNLDRLMGEEMKCHVELKEENGKVALKAGKGAWAGKATGAAAVALVGTLPFCLPVLLCMAALGICLGKNVINQASLPEQICSFAEAFLAS